MADQLTAGDRRRAAALLAASVTGDQLGISATVVEAQQAGRVGPTVAAIAGVLVDALPALRKGDVVDRLRAVIAATDLDTLPPDAIPHRQNRTPKSAPPAPVTNSGLGPADPKPQGPRVRDTAPKPPAKPWQGHADALSAMRAALGG